MKNFFNELKNYNPIPRELVFDNTLSDRARFVYVFMACKPDDWDFYLEPMARDIGYSVDTLRKYISELVGSGWLEKGKQSNENGVFGCVTYTLKATKITDTKNYRHGKIPTRVFSDTVKTPHNIKETINIKENNNIKERDDAPRGYESFDFSFVSDDYAEAYYLWLAYKRDRKQKYANSRSAKVCYDSLVKLSNGDPNMAIHIVNQSITNNWAGIFPLKNNYGTNQKTFGVGQDNQHPTDEQLVIETANAISQLAKERKDSGLPLWQR